MTKRNTPDFFIERSLFIISGLLLFFGSFAWLITAGKDNFSYQESRFLFIFTCDYLKTFLSEPGGLLTWSGNFLMQGYFNTAYASLISSLLVLLFYFLLNLVIKKLRNEGPLNLLLALVPSAILLVAQARYDFHLQHPLGLIFSLLLFLLIHQDAGKKHIITFIIFPIAYFLLGSYAIVSGIMYMTHVLLNHSGKGKYIAVLVFPAYAAAVILISRNLLFYQTFRMLLGYPLIYNETAALNNTLIVLAVIITLYPVPVNNPSFKIRGKAAGWLRPAAMLLSFTLTFFFLLKQHDPVLSGVFRIEKYYREGETGMVINEYEKGDYGDIVAQYFYNLSLAQEGELCSRMFHGPQAYGPLSLSLEGRKDQISRTMYFYYATGLVNEAHHLAYELMVQHGFTAENLKMLIRTELLRGNYRPAARYNDILKKTLHYRKWAMEHQAMIDNPELISSDRELSEKMKLLPGDDFFVSTDDSRNLVLLLRSNPQNKTAFEYVLARLLLEKDIMAVADQANKLKELGYASIPQHIEEALIAFKAYSGKSADTGGLPVSAEAEKRFLQYGNIISRTGGNKIIAGKAIRKGERNTFWYYLQFNTIKSDFFRPGAPEKTIN